MKRDKLYYSINFIVLLLTVILFVPMAFAVVRGADNQVWLCFMGLFCLAAAVHILKAFRLWFALYGHGIPFSEYMIQYCKAVPVSVVLPCKLGDLLRAYCFGHLIHNYLSGVLVVLLDRFCDTLALVVEEEPIYATFQGNALRFEEELELFYSNGLQGFLE